VRSPSPLAPPAVSKRRWQVLGLASPSTLCYRFRNGRSSALALLRNPNLARAHPWTGVAVRHEPWRGGRKAFGTRLCGGICSGYLADSVLVALGLAALLQSAADGFALARAGSGPQARSLRDTTPMNDAAAGTKRAVAIS
jgi:hypothetical protein